METERRLSDGRNEAGDTPLKRRLFEIIFLSDTPGGRAFDVCLIVAILVSVGAIMLDSVESVNRQYAHVLDAVEWGFTLLFSAEYAARLWCVRRPATYARSFFGIVDLLSVAPTYLAFFFPATTNVLVVRILRILRLFRILKLARYVGEADTLLTALRQSRRKITVFLYAVFTIVVIFGALMYLIEGEDAGFTSIPRGVYWAIVTLTTVGYGDIAPQTPVGQGLSSIIMVMGYGIIAVPTGIYATELREVLSTQRARRACPECGISGHEADARFCRRCGGALARHGTTS